MRCAWAPAAAAAAALGDGHREEARGGRLLITPVACQWALFGKKAVPGPSLACPGKLMGASCSACASERIGESSSARCALCTPPALPWREWLCSRPLLAPLMRLPLPLPLPPPPARPPVLGWRRVMPPRSFLISSTSCTPSAGLGFLGRMYRSRCRPRLDEVKACPQKGQERSLVARALLELLFCAVFAFELGVDGEFPWLAV